MNPIQGEYTISQGFGANGTLYRRWGLVGHNGIDMVAPHGTPLLAVEDCIVVDVKTDPEGYGKHIRIMSKTHTNGLYRVWVYGHCDRILKVVGEEVKKGEVIATMGNTGFVISGDTEFWGKGDNKYGGTHLHLGLRQVTLSEDGWSYPDSNVKIKVYNYNNGYKGAIDPAPFLETEKRYLMKKVITLATEVIRLLKLKI